MAIKEMRSLNFGGPDTYVPVPTDWNQTDETQPDFLKNKPFGDELVEIMPETEIIGVDNEGMYIATLDLSAAGAFVPNTILVVFDGTEYVCENNEMTAAGAGVPAIWGNLGLLGGEEDSGEPFLIFSPEMLLPDGNPHTVSIYGVRIISIPEKYVPCTRFYFKNGTDPYLYIDPYCTVKATIKDMPNHSNVDVGLSPSGLVARWYRANMVTGMVTNETYGYGEVWFINGNEILILYTAEYEPTT